MTDISADEDPFRPASEILAIVEEALNAPDVPPPTVTPAIALATRPDDAWPCLDWCCTRGCPGPGNSLCRTATTRECHGRCTCGQQHIRDTVRALQDAIRPLGKAWMEPGRWIISAPTLTRIPPPEPRCTRPSWLPTRLHFHTCPSRGAH